VKVFFKILLVSFPIVVAGVIFWPNLQVLLNDKLGKHVDYSSTDPSLDEPLPWDIKSDEPEKKVQTQSVVVPESEARIYRWIDENGHTVFSDRPRHEDAVAFKPKELGDLSVTGLPEPDRRTVSHVVKRTVKPQKVVVSRQVKPKFKFSTLSAIQRDDYVELSGRVSAGYACEKLKIIVSAKNDRGMTVSGSDIIRSKGVGSSLFEVKLKVRANNKGRWSLWEQKTPTALCLDN
jgi:hypothetical protein